MRAIKAERLLAYFLVFFFLVNYSFGQSNLSSTGVGGPGCACNNGETAVNVLVPAGTEVSVPHSLGSAPQGVVFIENRGGHVQNGDTPDDATDVYLKNIGAFDATVSIWIIP